MTHSSTGRQPTPRVRKKRERARREILQTASGILREQGIESVTLDSVAGVLGMTKQALYHYFPSKEALMKGLVTTLLDDEVESLLAAIGSARSGGDVVETLIRGFYAHYIGNLGAFRAVYCQSQLYSAVDTGMDKDTIREQINPRTHRLFDVLEARLAADSTDSMDRERLRRFAFVAWTSALGLLTMLSVADAVGDPLIHRDADLLSALSDVFRNASASG